MANARPRRLVVSLIVLSRGLLAAAEGEGKEEEEEEEEKV